MAGKVAILGTGPMAVMLALEMVRKATPEQLQEITFISRDEKNDIGRGQIGKTKNPHHLLNVLGAKMSGDPEDPDDFVKWAKRKIAENTQDAQEMIAATAFFGIDGKDPANNYVSRKFYSQYMNEFVWQKLQEEARAKGIVLTPVKGEIERVEDKIKKPGSTVTISLKDGRKVEADVVDLAFGLPPKRLENEAEIANVPGFVSSLYQPPEGSIFKETDLRGRDTKDMTVVFIGSGLSTVDGLGQLAATGYEGKVKVISPSGRLPITHKDPKKNYEPYKADYTLDDAINAGTENDALKAKKIYEFIVLKAEQAVLKRQAWQEVIDGFRAHIPALWKKLDNREKKEFFDHYYPLWGDVRHRIPQQVEDKINEVLGDRIEYIQGRVKDIYNVGDTLQVAYEPVNEPDPTKRGIRTIEAHGEVVKALGWDFKNLTDHPLLKEMHEADMIRRGKLGLGLQAHEDSRHNIRIVGQTRFQDELELTGFGELRPHAIAQAEKTLAMLDVQKQKNVWQNLRKWVENGLQGLIRWVDNGLQELMQWVEKTGDKLKPFFGLAIQDPEKEKNAVENEVAAIFKRHEGFLDTVIEEQAARIPKFLEKIAQRNVELFDKITTLRNATPRITPAQLVTEIKREMPEKGFWQMFQELKAEYRPKLDTEGLAKLDEQRRMVMGAVHMELPEILRRHPNFLKQEYMQPKVPSAPEGYGNNVVINNKENHFFAKAFAFAAGQRTPLHDHKARCISVAISGEVFEVIYEDAKNPNSPVIALPNEGGNPAYQNYRIKRAGEMTISSPVMDNPEMYNPHIIIKSKDSNGVAVLLHFYDGIHPQPDGSIDFATSRETPSVNRTVDETSVDPSGFLPSDKKYTMIVRPPENLRETRGLSGNEPSLAP